MTKVIAPPPGEQGGEGGDPFGGGEGGEGDVDGNAPDPNDPSGSSPGGETPPKPTPGAITPAAAPPAPAPKAPIAADSETVKAAGIMFRAPDGTVLLLKRRGGDHEGEWCFPGGKVEAGESRKEAARREAREEIGEHPEGTLREVENNFNADDNVDFTTFVQDVSAPFVPTLNHEHTSWAWATPEALPQPMHPGPLYTLTGRDVDEPVAA